ncbi:hypothetical protein NQ038_03390 [Brevibacterium sp. 50QC2O2]|uniref:hypothetical protein n=1 Tax=Brevibacterium TaxID=1696 RepID=UPI00211B98F1|nr:MULTISPECIES: hypothetical protein [unclassified Brevibacterium]MCQ9368904.1 hypothetical protein [Brevibacterium sp. 91QC2O2]MCQ9386023.1 hypothetical protein [Brevibacterium sp. 68QC2CO]MCQ9387686.1 hypothetical protein [Brevibacterium sp. 50QC2O2]
MSRGTDVGERASDPLVTLHESDNAAREHITAHAQEGKAITVATNDEAAALNERIRTGRVERGEVDDIVTETGSDGLSIGSGDLIQTRKNSSDLGVANRQQWIVQHVTEDGTVYARGVGSGRKHRRTVALPPEYVGEHAHLSYAATAYGVQGATVDASHTVLSEATSAAGVYVGMTRGREQNQLHVVAENLADARAQFIEAMERDPADRGLDYATAQAVEAVRGLAADGPVRLVTDELARLDEEAERAHRQAQRWEKAAAYLDAQRAAHRAEDDEDAATLHRVEDEAARLRAEVTAPLTMQAEADGAAYVAVIDTEAAASARLATVGPFGRRKARTEHRTATEQVRTTRAQLRDAWDAEPPRTLEALPAWMAQAAARRAETDPRVGDADRAVHAAHSQQKATQQRHQRERTALLVSGYGTEHTRRDQFGMRTVNPHRDAADARTRAALIRAEARELRNLPVSDAARRIEANRAQQEQEQARRRAERRERQLHDPFEHESRRPGPHRDGAARSL